MIPSFQTCKIGVLCGGTSAERAVSLRSGQNVYNALIRLGYNATMIDTATAPITKQLIDIAYIALHGQGGEDGVIQGYLSFLGIPFTGSGVLASAVGMNKYMTKQWLVAAGLPTPDFAWVDSTHQCPSLPFPVMIKPLTEGSSVGIQRIETPADFQEQVPAIVAQYGMCLVETAIIGQEITVGVIEPLGVPTALPILELVPKNTFYDYEAKYTHGLTDFILPARLSESVTATCQQLAVSMHHGIGCKGMSRVDMMVDPVRGPMILEINTIPGMTDVSDLPAAAKHAGMSFDTLVESILSSAL